MSDFLKLLNLILSFGPKLPLVMEQVEIIVAAFQAIVDIVNPGVFSSAGPVDLTDEEADLEAKILAKCPSKAAFAGPFQSIFAFLKAHPELITILLGLFAKK